MVLGLALSGWASHFVGIALCCLPIGGIVTHRYLVILSLVIETVATSEFLGFLFLFLGVLFS